MKRALGLQSDTGTHPLHLSDLGLLGGSLKALKARADLALEGMLTLPGTSGRPYFVGNPPDWFADPFRDPEYTWALNRLEHWVVLLTAWRATGAQKYLERLNLELRDWLQRVVCPQIDPQGTLRLFNDENTTGRAAEIARVLRRVPAIHRIVKRLNACYAALERPFRASPANALSGPTPYNTKPWRTLEVAARMVHVLPLIAQSLAEIAPGDDSLRDAMRATVEQHGRVLALMPKIIYPNADHNHYLLECLGLLHVATSFPELPESNAWSAQAISELERCAEAQFTAEGGHIEGCPHYHNVAVYLLAEACRLARRAKTPLSSRTETILARSLHHCIHTLRPNGSGVPVGDSDADQLAAQAALFGYLANGDPSVLRAVVRMTGVETLRDLCVRYWPLIEDPKLLFEICGQRDTAGIPLTSYQPQLGQVTMRTGWDRHAISLFFHCRTPVKNGHSHADPGSFDLTAFGQPLLIDPGRYTYAENRYRRAIRSAAWHNTLTIDGREPFVYLSSMHWGPQQSGNISGFYASNGVQAAECYHRNFHPATHRRLAAIVDDRAVVIVDRVFQLNSRSKTQLNFHVASARVDLVAPNLAQAVVGDVAVAIAVLSLGEDTMTSTCSPAFYSPRLDERLPSTIVRFADQVGTSNRCIATLILPRRSAASLQPPTLSNLTACGRLVQLTFKVDERAFVLQWVYGDKESQGQVHLI